MRISESWFVLLLALHPARAGFGCGQVITVLSVVNSGTHKDREQHRYSEVFHRRFPDDWCETARLVKSANL